MGLDYRLVLQTSSTSKEIEVLLDEIEENLCFIQNDKHLVWHKVLVPDDDDIENDKSSLGYAPNVVVLLRDQANRSDDFGGKAIIRLFIECLQSADGNMTLLFNNEIIFCQRINEQVFISESEILPTYIILFDEQKVDYIPKKYETL